jgi:catechol 2,3-dioxygenase-like lactoylglutathione lyase family enzyme
MAIGQLRTVVVDCLDPDPLAEFWSAVLGVEVAHRGDDWVSLHAAGSGHPRVAFQRVPEPKVGKNRLHLDVWVEDIPHATVAAEALGATRVGDLVADSGEPFQILADPAGNEFCLVHLPGSTGP